MTGKRNNTTIPASALGYAISFLLLVGLITSGVLFTASANKRLEINYEISEHLLFDNYLSMQYASRLKEDGSRQLIHSGGDTTDIIVKNWGVYRVVVASSHHRYNSVIRSFFVGYLDNAERPALYYPDHNKKLVVCGDTKVEGNVIIPKNSVDRGFIAGKNYSGQELIYGSIKKSDKSLPSIKIDDALYDIQSYSKDATRLLSCEKDSSYSFLDKTGIYSTIHTISIQNDLEGNLLIHSFDSILVSSEAKLKHVILMAPVIHFEKGFKGCVQAIAEKRIICEEDVNLEYPSALVVLEKEHADSLSNGIYLKENAQILGGVLLYSDQPDNRKAMLLEIQHATIGGLVYNVGETEVQGTIIGSLYTNELTLHVGGGDYSGYLLDATISSKKLPKDFAVPRWLETEDEPEPIILACF